MDHVLEKENEILAAVAETKELSENAEGAAAKALTFRNGAEGAAETATQAAQRAAGLAGAASEQAGRSEQAAAASEKAAEEAKKAAEGAGGVNVTGATPGQLIIVKEVDENGKPTAWEAVDRTHWVEGDLVEILPETAAVYDAEDDCFCLMGEGITLTVGEEYTVAWNGVEYVCKAQDTSSAFDGTVSLGNCTLFGVAGLTGAGEPFVMVFLPPEGVAEPGVTAMIVATDGSTEATVSIHQGSEIIHKLPGKFLPDGVPYVEDGGLVELPVTGAWEPDTDSDGDGVNDFDWMYIVLSPIGLEVGKTYTVDWNGTKYEVVGLDLNELSGGETPGVFLGNSSYIGGEDNGMPFMLAELPAEIGAEAGYYGYAFGAEDTEVSFTIYTGGVKIHKLDNRCLDLDWLPIKAYSDTLISEQTIAATLQVGDVYCVYISYVALEAGQRVRVVYDGTVYDSTVYANGNTKLIGNGSLNSVTDRANTGEPFLIMFIPADSADNDLGGIYCTVPGEHTLAVFGERVNKLPEEYLPESADSVILRSSTADSTKRFKLTVDDSGTLTATEV